MEAVVLDVIGRVLLGVDHYVLRRRVQHVAHPNVLQVGDVADRLPVADDDPVENLITIHPERTPLVKICRRFETRHGPVLPGARVHDGVDQLVARSLARN